ncbi:MAG: ribosome biogenesis factor YjgA [Granulosicoccaceae bacterium]|jgi:ribosome-associated protein
MHDNDESQSGFDADDHIDDRPSKSQRKRDMLALTALGEQLVDLPASTLARLPLDDRLRQAIRECQSINQRGGRKRQLKFIGKLMREADADAIRDTLEQLAAPHHESVRAFHRVEQWRDRLLDEGDPALGGLLDEHPDADRQLLRQLLRNARNQKLSEARQKQAARELFRYLRDLLAS